VRKTTENEEVTRAQNPKAGCQTKEGRKANEGKPRKESQGRKAKEQKQRKESQ